MACVFCGSTVSLTTEHVYAQWVRQIMLAIGPTNVTRGEAQSHVRTDTGLSVVLRKRVCQSCNTGWLSMLERRVERWVAPALVGQKIALAPATQRIVAAWAVKQALLLEWTMRQMRSPTYVPESNLRWLYEHRDDPVAPPGCQVWVAAVDAQLGTADSLAAWNMAASAGEDPNNPDQFFATFSAGYFVVQVAGQDFREGGHLTRAGKPLLTFARPDELLPFLISIWPGRDDLIVWPPLYGFRRTDLRRLAQWGATVGQRFVRVKIPQLK